MDNSNKEYYTEKGFDIKVFIQSVRKILSLLWAQKKLILLISLIGGLLFSFIEYRKKINYLAELTFMLNSEESNSLNGTQALLGQFGFGGINSSEYNLDKIISLSKSKKIINEVLFDSLLLKNNKDLIINHLIDLYGMDDLEFQDELISKSFRFKHGKSDDFTLKERTVLKFMYESFIGKKKNKALYKIEYDELTSIINMRVNSIDEQLSIGIANSIFNFLSKFYVDQSIEKQQQNYTIVKLKADSIKNALEESEYLLAKKLDNSQGFNLRVSKLEEQKLNRTIQILSISYGEVLKNLATAEYILETSKPVFQIIDEPITPLEADVRNYLSALTYGFIAFCFFSVVLIVLFFAIKENL